MDKPPIRRLNLSDLVILVAASAIGVLILRIAHEARTAGPAVGWDPPWSWKIGMEVSPFLISTAAGLVIARLIQPRPPWRRLFRQPGAMACLVILVGAALGAILRFGNSMVAMLKGSEGVIYAFDSLLNGWMFGGHDVALAWAILALARAWRPEPSWVDRAGRCLGVLAIVMWIATALML